MRETIEQRFFAQTGNLPSRRSAWQDTALANSPYLPAFREQLDTLGINATVRRNRGTDIAAACGQLAAGGQPPLS